MKKQEKKVGHKKKKHTQVIVNGRISTFNFLRFLSAFFLIENR